VLLAAIACATFLSTLTGGLFAWRLKDRLHLVLGFSAGAVFGVVFFDLLPEALALAARTGSAAAALSWTAAGFLVYLTIDRIILIHGAGEAHGAVTHRGSIGAGVLSLHSLLDGVAIGLAFQASRGVGVIVAIAVLTHDFSDGINTMSVVVKHQGGHRRAFGWLLADAAAPAAGLALTQWFTAPAGALGFLLAVFAGFFLYIGASDLIPESFHAHPKFLTTAMTLAGAAVLYLAMTLAAGAATAGVAALPAQATTMHAMAAQCCAGSRSPSTAKPASAPSAGSKLMRMPKVRVGRRASASISSE
jgi:ZIP family zinc transporter